MSLLKGANPNTPDPVRTFFAASSSAAFSPPALAPVICLAAACVPSWPGTKGGSGPLHIAALVGSVPISLMLLNANADVDEVNSDGRTALHCAAHAGCGRPADPMY